MKPNLDQAVFIGTFALVEDTTIEYGTSNTISNQQLAHLVSTFHAKTITTHKEQDSWFMGIRANHFVVEIGTTEVSLEELGLTKYQEELGIKEYMNYLDDGTLEGESPQFCIVTGNHKGARMFTVWLLADTMKIKGQTGIAHEETV